MANNQIALLAGEGLPKLPSASERETTQLNLQALRDQATVRSQGMADDAATRDVYKNNADPQERLKALYSVNPKAAMAAEKFDVELGKERATTSKTQIEGINLRTARYKDALSTVQDREGAAAWVKAMYSDPDIGKHIVQELGPPEAAIARIPDPATNPQGFAAWKRGSQLGAEKLAELSKPIIGSRDLGGTVQNTATDPFTGVPTVTGTSVKTQSPDSVASGAIQIRGQNLQAGQAGARLAFDKSKESATDGVEGNFTDAAIDAAAARYNLDGTLPPMGMGKAGALGRSRILNRAAEVAGADGASPEEQRIAQIGNKGNTAALSKLQQQQTMVGAFERNFVKNADIVEEYSKKVDRTGVPILNKWINAGKRNVGGDADLAAFDVGIKAVSNEYAKIISGSMGNTATAQGEIAKVSALLAAAQTPEQVTSVVNLMRRETQNRMKGFEEEKAALRASMAVRKPKAGGANTNAKGWTLHTDANGNKAYVSPDGKQFEEVK